MSNAPQQKHAAMKTSAMDICREQNRTADNELNPMSVTQDKATFWVDDVDMLLASEGETYRMESARSGMIVKEANLLGATKSS